MKRLVTIISVAALLMGAAIYYRMSKDTNETPPDGPGVTSPNPEEPIPDDPDNPNTDATSKGTLTLAASVSHSYVETGKRSDQYAAFDIEAKEVEGGTRPPLNLAVVIDRSGSMSGNKIRHARSAAAKLVDELSEDDHLTVVSYGSNAQVTLQSTRATTSGKTRMRQAINRIGASGGTNIGDGIDNGFRQLEANRSPESIDRMILLSDGHPTVGMTGSRQLTDRSTKYRRAGVSLTTMGVGLDYNEDLMSAMARAGAGNYYFIDKPQSSAKFFASEFDDLSETVAKNTALTITLDEGVELENLFGFDYDKSGRTLTVPLAEFGSGEEKNILTRLRIAGADPGKQDVLEARLTYHDVTSDDDALQEVALHSVATQDGDMLEDGVNTEVISRVKQIETAESIRTAMEAYERGDRDRANKVLKKNRRDLSQARKKYKLKDAEDFQRVEAELDDTADKVNRAKPSSATGKKMIKKNKERSGNIEIMRGAF